MLPSTPECDFPIKIPDNFLCCGPIFVPGNLDGDPDLKAWLEGRETAVEFGTFLEGGGEACEGVGEGD
jgi:hypothetical protein